MPLLLPDWLDPEFLLTSLGNWALWGAALIVFIECAIFPVLPGDSLLFAVGMFIANDAPIIHFGDVSKPGVLAIAMAVLVVAAVLAVALLVPVARAQTAAPAAAPAATPTAAPPTPSDIARGAGKKLDAYLAKDARAALEPLIPQAATNAEERLISSLTYRGRPENRTVTTGMPAALSCFKVCRSW